MGTAHNSTMSRDEVRAALREVDWSELAPRLLLYALRRLRSVSSRGSAKRPTLLGMDAQDFSETAVEKLLSGRRTWPRGAALWQVLCGIISSDIYNAIRRNQKTEDADVSGAIDNTVSDPLDECSYQEEREQILELLKDDPDAQKVARYIMDENHDDPKQFRPQAMAEALGMPTRTISNAKKRLQRRLGFQPYRPSADLNRKQDSRKKV